MASILPEETVRRPVMRARWRNQAFVHWPVPVEAVEALLPAGLVVDVYDDRAWVTLTPLWMADVRLAGVPQRRGPGRHATFPETNLRTYVRGPGGRDGLWFFSLDVTNAALTAAARAGVGAPYHLADLSITELDGDQCYAGTRRGGRPSYQLRVRPGAPIIEPSARDIWLTSRWRAYTRHAGVLLETAVAHEPWPLRRATITEFREDLSAAAGLPPAPADLPSPANSTVTITVHG